MAHKVRFYDTEKGFDEDGVLRPVREVETDDAAEAERLAGEAMAEAGSMMAADIRVDWRLCETLEDYLHLANATGRWLEANPIEGCWIGQLTEDPEHWAGYGITTPEELEKHLILEAYSDTYKSVHGVRPRGHGMTMDTPIEEIEEAYDRLTDLAKMESGDLEP